jgi:hypothetical protein
MAAIIAAVLAVVTQASYITQVQAQDHLPHSKRSSTECIDNNPCQTTICIDDQPCRIIKSSPNDLPAADTVVSSP